MVARLLFPALVGAMLAGCTKEEPVASGGGAPGPAERPAWLLTAAPGDALEIASAKQTVAEGDTVVLRGRIGGRMDAMSKESPSFVMMDLSIPSCADMGEDHCPTPWDYCCEPSGVLAENSATVMVVDAGGSPVAADLRGAGLSPLDEVIVVGTVGARPEATVLTVRATGVHRVGG